jgi:pyridoxal phosphate enzyme (YggS family)
MNGSISQIIARIQQEIPDYARLIAVTKQVSSSAMRIAYEAGIRDFGENRLQEALNKQQELSDLPDINWHFIGHLQKNKARKIIEHFDWIHSVDNLAIARRLNILAADLNRRPQVCLQVKILEDPNKYGWHPPELLLDLLGLDRCENLDIQGLMTILPLGLSSAEKLSAFQATQQLALEIARQNYPHLTMQQLSMGMSDDYLEAIEAGATMIRLGSMIFGSRS